MHAIVPFAPSAKTRAAHATLYRTHAPELRALARSVLGYHADADDVVVAVFVNAWALAVERPALPPPPIAWLRVEVQRIALAVRHQRSREALMPIRAW